MRGNGTAAMLHELQSAVGTGGGIGGAPVAPQGHLVVTFTLV